MKKLLLFLILLLLTGVFNSVSSQTMKWKKLAPNIMQVYSGPEFGAIKSINGTILAGWRNLALSTDNGTTWTILPNPFQAGEYIIDLDMYDESTFVLMTVTGHVFLSTDKGNQWTSISNTANGGRAVAFLRSPTRIVTLSSTDVSVITIGGITNSYGISGSFWSAMSVAADGSIRVMAAGTSNGSSIFSSTDLGLSWTKLSNSIYSDIFSIITDPTDPNRFALVNENWVARTGGNSDIILTTDNGSTWTTTFSQPLGGKAYLSGNYATSCNDYFIGSESNGIFRSSDKGLTWESIGGPPIAVDSRNIAAANDSIIFAMDNNGSIWSTDPVSAASSGTPAIAGTELFGQMKIFVCDSSVTKTIYVSRSACTALDILTLKVIGANSSEYSIIGSLSTPGKLRDSVQIKFTPNASGVTDAQLQITYSDGTTATLPISVSVDDAPAVTFDNSITLTAYTDTIAGDVELLVPIIHSGFAADAEFTIHFDSLSLAYHGVFDTANIDHTIGHPDNQSARIRFNTDTTATLFARFSYFPVDSTCTRVRFDSLTRAGKASCLSILSSSIEGEICSPAGCGRQTLARFVRLGRIPTLMVTPNPGSGTFIIESSESLGTVTISVSDKLGATVLTQSSELSQTKPATIHLESLSSGVYFLRVPDVPKAIPIVLEK